MDNFLPRVVTVRNLIKIENGGYSQAKLYWFSACEPKPRPQNVPVKRAKFGPSPALKVRENSDICIAILCSELSIMLFAI